MGNRYEDKSLSEKRALNPDLWQQIQERHFPTEHGGEGSSIEVYDEGVLISKDVGTLKFFGDEVDAIVSGTNDDGNDIVEVHHSSVSVTPFYNNGVASVDDVATVSRRIASPTSEGNPFKIGSWTGGDFQAALRDSSLVYATPSEFSVIDDSSSTFTARIMDADGVTAIATHQITLDGLYDQIVNGIRIQIENWAMDFTKYKAKATVTFNLSTILPAGGRFSVEITHDNDADGLYQKAQGPMFYDTEPQAQTISGVSIAEASIVSSKYLSGVRFYSTGDLFDIAIADMDWLNSDSYPDDIVILQAGPDYGISDRLLQVSDLTGHTTLHNAQNVSYAEQLAIDEVDFRSMDAAAQIAAQVLDWDPGAIGSSSAAAVLVDTYGIESNDLAEFFTDEAQRRTSADAAWDSTQNVTSYDSGTGAQVIGGVLKVPAGNFSSFAPAGNPNYTGETAPKDFYRRFTDASMLVRNSGIFAISGFTLSDLIAGDIEIYVTVPGRMTNGILHGADTFSFATFTGTAGDPIRKANSTSNTIEFSMGALGLTPAQNYMIVRIVITNASIEPDSIVLSF